MKLFAANTATRPRERRLAGAPLRVGVGAAFTLAELLVVIAIIALLTSVSLPAIRKIARSDTMNAANRQLVDDLAYARRLAIRNRSTVYVVFMPPCDETWPRHFIAFANSLSAPERDQVRDLLGLQCTGYAMFAFRRVGDQPGQKNPVYLRDWSALPAGVFIPRWKYYAGVGGVPGFQRVAVPFPNASSPPYPLPCVAFNYLGQLVQFDNLGNPLNTARDEAIPLARGAVLVPRDEATGEYLWQPPQIVETPPGNSINNYNHVHVDWMTGRARIERPELPR